MLVESRPFDPSNPLGLRFRRRELDHLPFELKLIARARWGEPPQFVNAKPGGKMLLRFPRLFMFAVR
jgi:hypothetical protein